MKLLILDRDGVINYDSDAYIKSVEEWQPLPGAIEAIAQLSKAGWTVAIATNQSGIARGYYDVATLDAMHARLRALVAEQGGEVGLIVYCPDNLARRPQFDSGLFNGNGAAGDGGLGDSPCKRPEGASAKRGVGEDQRTKS